MSHDEQAWLNVRSHAKGPDDEDDLGDPNVAPIVYLDAVLALCERAHIAHVESSEYSGLVLRCQCGEELCTVAEGDELHHTIHKTVSHQCQPVLVIEP